jgi:hypothetical protein
MLLKKQNEVSHPPPNLPPAYRQAGRLEGGGVKKVPRMIPSPSRGGQGWGQGKEK